MLVFSANPKNSPAISAFFHAELPVKLMPLDVLDGRHAGAFGLSEVQDVQAVADFHCGKRVLQSFDGGLGKRCSIEREHVGSVVWFLPKDVDQ
jgi:hypothetical protein